MDWGLFSVGITIQLLLAALTFWHIHNVQHLRAERDQLKAKLVELEKTSGDTSTRINAQKWQIENLEVSCRGLVRLVRLANQCRCSDLQKFVNDEMAKIETLTNIKEDGKS